MGGHRPKSPTLNLKADSVLLRVRIPSPSLPDPAAVCVPTGAGWGRGRGTYPRHSRLRSAAPLPPAGPPLGSCSELASPNSLGCRGKMWKRLQKTRERRKVAGAAKKPAPPRGLPSRSAGTAESELIGTNTNSLSTARALRPEAPPPFPRNPAPSPAGVCSIPKTAFFQDSLSDISRFTVGSSLLQRKAPYGLTRLFSRRLQLPGCRARCFAAHRLWLRARCTMGLGR